MRNKKKRTLLLSMTVAMALTAGAQTKTPFGEARHMWASVNNISNTTVEESYKQHNNKLLVSWRMLPTDTWETSFHLYSRAASNVNGMLTRRASNVKASTCAQIATMPTSAQMYYLVRGDFFEGTAPANISNAEQKALLRENALDSLLIDERIYSNKLPYVSIPLKDTKDVCSIDTIVYQANDCSLGDLDGDGNMEIVVKRLQTTINSATGAVRDEQGIGGSYSNPNTIYAVIWDAYKLDGTFMWRIKGGPGIILGNSSAFAIADFDGDGCAEMAIRTCEGTVFGDGKEIGDTDGDGRIDYRTWVNYYKENEKERGWIDHYNSAGPEFLSIIDGKTGKELARDNYIYRETSKSWGDDYWKRACSFRVGAGCFDETGLPSVIIGRGVYAHSVIEAWDWRNGSLTKRWRFDTNVAGTGKDGNPNSAYAAQGNHSFNVADLDGDGLDEIMYGSMAVDHDGQGLWTTKLGHGDANHVGKFIKDREGLQMYHCLEGGKTLVALHDARDGSVIWNKVADDNVDMGRCMVADIDPSSPGFEYWWAGSNAWSFDGTTDLGYKPKSCNMGIWFDGTLSRQLINENIIDSPANGRTFTIYRYDESFINGTKSNPSWYGDFLGDWREEFIVPDNTKLKDLKIFSTWYPSNYKFPYLMSDHTYWMQCINQNIGYNQPTNLGYYMGSDMDMADVPLEVADGIVSVKAAAEPTTGSDAVYDLWGRRVYGNAPGIYVRNGRKYVIY